ncbi:glycoside hydrolase family 2 [Paenibacillus sp. 598K]|uniref:beta-mannosidase n=1 Tax=Paenibacillus sp. 598K TaxID=1117987 RepID=UPI000FF9B354|nr:glycoside hydrolase family 2 protein [Paenibacillus sp. 598K]GBF74059.1 glycoside hydrolase family 2 [Paenibacillus sp. 598K]
MGEMKWTIGNWEFKSCEEEKWLPAQVPGCVHTDLYRNERIANPFYGTNEHRLQWIDKQDWEYQSRFEAPAELLGHTRIELVFEGLDTYADVSLNGHAILSADNMFRSWRVDVKPYLIEGANTLHVRFRSPIQEDLPKLRALGYALPASNDQSELGGLGDDKVSIFARKAPYHYGWDWGPRLVTSGIWREVRLEGWSGVQFGDLYIRQDEVSAERAQLTAVATVRAEASGAAELTVTAAGQTWQRTVDLKAGDNTVELQLDLAEPRLWWCRGLGDAHLYTFRAIIDRMGRTSEREARTGLRKVRLVREQDRDGATFYIELNGVPVFAKGANHIPGDSFVTEMTYERYRHEVASAAASNMNMLRVWGGGIYEQTAFYELCDEYGILVWQDFMFACSMYPGDPAFLDNVRAEAEENVKRLRNHPSIALWCGNNEIDSAWAQYNEHGGWGWKKAFTPEQRDKLWADYEAVFHDILPAAVSSFADGIDYWPSSPMQALTRDKEQHATSRSSVGDIHYWGVWHAGDPFDDYNVNIGRFMSEYGFQSFPEYKSVRTYAEESDLALESDVMLAHQRNGAGNRIIKQYMDQYLPEPKDFPAFLYLSQVLQAEAMKTAIEAHRRRKPYCMGTLYWQMNDCWPVASWAGMDYYGRWKALQYYAKRSFQDTMLSIDGSQDGQVGIHLLNDTLAAVEGELKLALFDFDGKRLKEESLPAAVASNSASLIVSRDTDELLAGADPVRTVLVAELWRGAERLDSREHYFVPGKQLTLSAAQVEAREVEGSGGTQFTLTTDTLAKQVWLSAEAEGVFSDNFFDLLPGQPVTVTFEKRDDEAQPFAIGQPGALSVRSMADFIRSEA